MSISPGSTITHTFGIQDASRAAANADALPTAALVRNGTVSAEVVTVTNIATGYYKFSTTIPADWAVGDDVSVDVTAIVGGVTGPPYRVWEASLQDGGAFVLGPLVAAINPANVVGKPLKLEMYQESTKAFSFAVYEADGTTPVDLSLKDLHFVLFDQSESPAVVISIEDADITVSGDDDEIALVTITDTMSALDATTYTWLLREATTKEVLLNGTLVLLPAVYA